MSNVFDKMKSRRRIRKYKPDTVPENLINKIMEAGSYAATGKNWQSPIVIAVTNPRLRDKISDMNRRIGGWELSLIHI